MLRFPKQTRAAGLNPRAISRNILFFVLFLGVAAFLLLMEGRPPTADRKEIEAGLQERFWQLKIHGRKKADVIFLGDSRVNQGISPEAFAAQLPGGGWSGRNLSFNAGGLNPEIFRLAESRLDSRSSHLRMIVLGVSPRVLTREGSRNEHYEKLKRRPVLYALAYIYFPRLMGMLSREPFDNEVEFFAGQNEYHDDGWQAAWRSDLWPDAWIRANRRLFKVDHIRPELQLALMEQVREWTEEGILVVGFRPPTSARIRQIENEEGGFDENAFATEFRNHGGLWIFVDPEAFHTYDNSHLPKGEAIKLSSFLGRQVAGHLTEID